TNGIYGFLSIYEKELAAEQPDRVVVCFDLPAPTFRHKQYDGYKAGRRGMPEELAQQLPLLRELLDAMKICRLAIEGYEADDLIGTLAARCDEEGCDCVILTGDKDNLQLVSDRVTVKLTTTKGGQSSATAYTPAVVQEVYGFEPCRIVDLKALMGDASDNIPGVAGIGEKTALDLLHRFGSVEELYRAIDEGTADLRPKQLEKLQTGRASAEMSYRLAEICRTAPIALTAEEMAVKTPDYEATAALLRKLEFKTFLEKLIPEETPVPDPERPALPLSPLVDAAQLQTLTAPAALAVAEDGLALCDGAQILLLSKDEAGDAWNRLAAAALGESLPKIVHDAKSTMTALAGQGLHLSNITFDPALAAYLLNPAAKTGLPDLVRTHLAREWDGSLPEAAAAVHQLTAPLSAQLEELGMTALLSDLELPLSTVLSEMEQRGFAVDEAALAAFGGMLKERIAELEEKIFSFVGKFNLNSPKQLGEVLFEKLGLTPPKRTRTGYSTDAETLEKLGDAHPILPLVLEYRKLSKLSSTYVEGFKGLAVEGRIHTTFHQTVTLTGRLSSAEPNLQNIPVREPLGRELRRMFAAKEGCLLLDADYSQIELRILAHIAGDERMCRAFLEGQDIHAITAASAFGVPLPEVTPEMRRSAKAVNFGIVYGISDFSLAADLHVSRQVAKQYIESYFATYPGIRRYLTEVVEKAKEQGYVTTLLGRRRYLPELKASNFNQRSFGERAAMNTPIQGTAADVIKLAMVRVRDRLLREGLEARLVLQVHDELIVETPEAEADAVARLLEEEMMAAMTLSVPLTVEVKRGRSWYDAH
ncbi:MAG: DNA polymerase I, partial [Clostridia bacterium]|nr:DNA polymerase I [Clostridia bacterium]